MSSSNSNTGSFKKLFRGPPILVETSFDLSGVDTLTELEPICNFVADSSPNILLEFKFPKGSGPAVGSIELWRALKGGKWIAEVPLELVSF